MENNIKTGKICSWPRMGFASRSKWWAIHNRMLIRSSSSRVRSVLYVFLHWKLSSRSRFWNNTTDNASRMQLWRWNNLLHGLHAVSARKHN